MYTYILDSSNVMFTILCMIIIIWQSCKNNFSNCQSIWKLNTLTLRVLVFCQHEGQTYADMYLFTNVLGYFYLHVPILF